jgi:hypothetical protein
MVIAAIAILVANRLLPADMAGKGQWEIKAFWGAWLLALIHAGWRSAPVAKAMSNPAWREQSLAIVVLAVTAVILNWITTGDNLIKTIFTDTYWAVAGVDLSLLATAAIALWAARKLKQRAQLPADANSRRVLHEQVEPVVLSPDMAAEVKNG